MELNKHKIDICAISELKKKGKGNSLYQNYILFYSGKDKVQRAQAGVGILLHEKYKNYVEEVQYVNSNIMSICLKLDKERVYFVSVYTPDMSKLKEERATFYDELQQLIDELPHNSKIFLMGDFNSRVGNEAIPGVMNRFNEEVINDNGEMLITICAQNELRINNTYYTHKVQQKYTYGNTRNQNSTIDYIITNREIHPSQILDVRTLTSANVGSEHGLVLCKYRHKKVFRKAKPALYVDKLNIESLKDDSTKRLYKIRLEGKLNEIETTNQENVDKMWGNIKMSIIESAKEALGSRRINLNGKRNDKPWFTTGVKALANRKKEAYLKYKAAPSAEKHNEYKRVRNETNASIKELKKSYWEKFSTDMEHDFYGGQRRIWNVLRNRKRPVNEEVQINTITPEKWVSYLKELYNNEEKKDHRSPSISEREYDSDPITREEVHKALKQLKSRKAPGPDQISNELLKYGGTKLEEVLTTLFQKIITTRRTPTDWKNSITIPIYKKGRKNNPENYRMISLLNSTSKLFTKIITKIITDKVDISEEQQGFRQNRSTVDAIFILRQIVEKSIEFNKPLFLCMVDLKKAFDRAKLADVAEILREKDIPEDYIQAIVQLNNGNKTKIKTQQGFSTEVPVTTGIRQGDSLSPTLFNLIMDKIIQSVKETKGGYRMGQRSMKILCFADDAILLAENEDDLQRMIYKFQITATRFNMHISIEKTESMVISREPIRCKLAVYDQPIQQSLKCNYLGVEVTSHRDLTREARTQANKASRIAGCLRDIIWKNKYMTTESKVRIYKTVVRPVLTYAVETRAETAKTKSISRATEMKVLRSIKGVTLRDQVRSEFIRQELLIQDVVRFGRIRRRFWRDHVDRMEENRWAKWAKNNTPNTKRPPGRPPKRWHESWNSASQLRLNP